MLNGATEEQVLANILSGPEFAARANALVGGADADKNFVSALYLLVLNRPGDAGEISGWVNTAFEVLTIETLFAGSAEFFQGS